MDFLEEHLQFEAPLHSLHDYERAAMLSQLSWSLISAKESQNGPREIDNKIENY